MLLKHAIKARQRYRKMIFHFRKKNVKTKRAILPLFVDYECKRGKIEVNLLLA